MLNPMITRCYTIRKMVQLYLVTHCCNSAARMRIVGARELGCWREGAEIHLQLPPPASFGLQALFDLATASCPYMSSHVRYFTNHGEVNTHRAGSNI